jgi:hypothetical protein
MFRALLRCLLEEPCTLLAQTQVCVGRYQLIIRPRLLDYFRRFGSHRWPLGGDPSKVAPVRAVRLDLIGEGAVLRAEIGPANGEIELCVEAM